MSKFSQFAQNKDAINFKNAFDEVVQAKVDASLADTKQEVASRLFGDSAPVVGEETLDEVAHDFDDHATWHNTMKKHGANRFVTTSDGLHKAYYEDPKVHQEHDPDRHIGTWDIHNKMGWLHEETINEVLGKKLN